MKLVIILATAIGAPLAWFGVASFATAAGVQVATTSNVLVAGVSRFGINLGGWSFWGADQFLSNILKNPGFEGLLDAAIVIPVHSGLSTFDDSPSWLARPDAFWEGAQYSIRSGSNAGRQGTIVHSSMKNYWGLPSFVARDGDPLPNPGDAVAIIKDNETGLPSQWWYSSDPGNSFLAETLQRRPGSPGVRSLRIKAGGSRPATVASYFDSIGERAGKLLPLTGTWNLSFWVRTDKGNASLLVEFGRQGSTAILSRNVALSNAWTNVQFTFAGEDIGPVGTANLLFQFSGLPSGEILLDDVDLRRAEDANQPFRHEVISALSRLHPAYIRDWQGQLGDTLTNRVAGPFARKSYRYRPGDDSQTDYGYGLADFLDLCILLKASPWIVVPPVFDDEECSGLGEYLQKQSDLHSVPEILLEFGNENWNSLFRPAGIPDPVAHGEAAGRCFSLIRKHAPALRLKTVINAQANYPPGAIQFAQQSQVSDIVAIAPYFFYSLSTGLPLVDRIAQLFLPNMGNIQTIATAVAPLHQDLAFYEVNLHTIEGTATADERRPVVAGIASGAALARTMLDSLALGVRRQCAYSLAGFDSQLTSQPGYVPLWGMLRDLGPTQRFRPTGLALALLNEAVQGDMMAVDVHGPKDVSVYSFRSPNHSATVFVSSSPSDRPVDFKLPGRIGSPRQVRLDELNSDAPDSTNEDSEGVRIRRGVITSTGGKISFNLRPWSVAVVVFLNTD